MRTMKHLVRRASGWHPTCAAACLIVAAGASAQAPRDVITHSNPATVKNLPATAKRLDLGGNDGMEFHRIGAIVPLRNGTFVVVNSGTSELRLFDASGRLQSTVGRRGGGPGEYSRIRDVVRLPGDSMAVLDDGARRVSILNPQAAFVRSFELEPPFAGGGRPTHVVGLRNGTLLVGYSEITTMAPQPTAVYFGQRLFVYSTTGSLQAGTGMKLPESEHFVQKTLPQMGGVAYWDLAFARTMTIRPDSVGVLVGDGTDWTVEQRNVEGKVTRTHQLQRPTVTVTAADKATYHDTVVAGSRPAEKVIAERLAEEMPFPLRKPAYRHFELDDLGRVWLESYPEPGETGSTWIRLDPRTRSATAVTLPARFRALAFTARLVYGVWRDSDDVEHVQVLALDGV